jgi:predicted nucleic acid-binding protein
MTTSKNRTVLFDTNILIYNQDKDSPFYDAAHKLHKMAIRKELFGIISPQNITELVAVITNSKRVTKPLSQIQVKEVVDEYMDYDVFRMIYPTDKTMRIYKDLLLHQTLRNSKHCFDMFLVATMLSHNVTQIVTYNKKDYTQFPEISVFPIEDL